jgi:hypothetical protein
VETPSEVQILSSPLQMLCVFEKGLMKTVTPRLLESFSHLIEIIHPQQIVEIGSWEGRSCLGFLTFAKAQGFHPKILCIDTWLGSIEHWHNTYPNDEFSHSSLGLSDGEPQILDVFRRSIREFAFEEQVEILRCPSAYSYYYLNDRYVDTDLVYIDGDHTTSAVLKDLELTSKACRKAYQSGDDFSWKSVRLALVIHTLGKKRKILVADNANTWIIIRSSDAKIKRLFLHRNWRHYSIQKIIVQSTVEYFYNRVRELWSKVNSNRESLKI